MIEQKNEEWKHHSIYVRKRGSPTFELGSIEGVNRAKTLTPRRQLSQGLNMPRVSGGTHRLP